MASAEQFHDQLRVGRPGLGEPVVHRPDGTRGVIHRCVRRASDSGARPQCGDVDASAYAAVLTADEELLDRLLETGS